MAFRPSAAATVSSLLMLVSFAGLGKWQLERAAEKQERIERFSGAPEMQGLPEPDSASEFTQLEIRGRFNSHKHILADNQVLAGRVGVHVYSPFELPGGELILVNRGWLPLRADRRELPLVEPVEPASSQEMITISGRLGPMPEPGRQLGEPGEINPEQWPQLLTYPDIDLIAAALNRPLYPWVLFLDEFSPGGFDGRHWKPVYMSPSKHRAYAFQWFALAITALFGWLLLAFRRGRQA